MSVFNIISICTILFVATIFAQKGNESIQSAAHLIECVIEREGLEAAIKTFDELCSNNQTEYSFDENEFNTLGYKFISAGKVSEAIEVFKMNVALFPDSANVYDSLGEGYMLNGDKDSAVVYYRKALELNPENWNADMNLKRMNGFVQDARNETREILKYRPGENTGLDGAYLGQRPPGFVPKVFAPGIVSTRGGFEFCCTWSPDGKELYFNRRGEGVLVSRWEKDGWTAPEVAPFCKKYPRAFEPHITYDGKRMFFGRGPEIWFMDREEDIWGEAIRHGPGMYVTTTLDRTIYMTQLDPSVEYGRIVRSSYRNGSYSEPERVGGGVNRAVGSAHPCIAPDESFIIFDSLILGDTEGEEHTDLFICYRRSDGRWSETINMGQRINTPGGNICASLSPDGKYLFYLRNRDIYWVDARIIEALKPEDLK
ncbi:MAG: PD40 domain-containing protein [Gemmatimonadota bacterium]|nr:MAG: PD40 domain-containing protein [Gemmatimonadota bacterium]